MAALGRLVGAAYGRLSSKRRRIALSNLERAFGASLPPPTRRRIASEAFRHFGRAAFEMLTMDRCTPEDIGTAFTYEGLENLRAAYARGRGVFVFSAHFGNWELVALMQGHLGLPLDLVTRPLDNAQLEAFFRLRREASGNRVIGKRSAVRGALRALGEGRGVAIVIDQNIRSGARVFVDFFHRTAATTPTLALLAWKTGAPVIPVFSYPGPGGGYHIAYKPEIPMVRTGDRDRDVLEFTQRCTALIEEEVRARPECWLWMHERWKSQPSERERAVLVKRGSGAEAV